MSSQVLHPTQELNHSDGQAEKFYRDLKQRGISVRVGLEATGYSRWFERLLAELGGDPAQIKAKRVKKQKTDRNDARLPRGLMRENNFPQICIPSPENRDLRQLLWHWQRWVQMRTRIMNQLQALHKRYSFRTGSSVKTEWTEAQHSLRPNRLHRDFILGYFTGAGTASRAGCLHYRLPPQSGRDRP